MFCLTFPFPSSRKLPTSILLLGSTFSTWASTSSTTALHTGTTNESNVDVEFKHPEHRSESKFKGYETH